MPRIRFRHLGLWLLAVPWWLTGCSGVQILNNLAPQSEVEVVRDLVFDAEKNLTLDLYRPNGQAPAQSTQGWPVVVFYWGGRWQEGDKAMYQFVGRQLASRGILTVIPNYRLWPQVGYQGFLQDSAQALAWTQQQITAYGGSAEKIVLMGHSAGAYNAMMLALDTPFADQPQHKLAGAIGLSGPYDFLPFTESDLQQMFAPAEDYEQTQPIYWANGKNAPVLLIHSQNDEVVYPKNSIHLQRQIQRHGGEAELVLIPELSHPMMIGAVSNLLTWKAPILSHIEQFVQQKTMVQSAVE
ncbi:MAG: alpha/beta hydrolase [Thiotrichales bacterium]|nr:alpha/beta hydrolase [Thiotrichales bacterium]